MGSEPDDKFNCYCCDEDRRLCSTNGKNIKLFLVLAGLATRGVVMWLAFDYEDARLPPISTDNVDRLSFVLKASAIVSAASFFLVGLLFRTTYPKPKMQPSDISETNAQALTVSVKVLAYLIGTIGLLVASSFWSILATARVVAEHEFSFDWLMYFVPIVFLSLLVVIGFLAHYSFTLCSLSLETVTVVFLLLFAAVTGILIAETEFDYGVLNFSLDTQKEKMFLFSFIAVLGFALLGGSYKPASATDGSSERFTWRKVRLLVSLVSTLAFFVAVIYIWILEELDIFEWLDSEAGTLLVLLVLTVVEVLTTMWWHQCSDKQIKPLQK